MSSIVIIYERAFELRILIKITAYPIYQWWSFDKDCRTGRAFTAGNIWEIVILLVKLNKSEGYAAFLNDSKWNRDS